MEGQYKMPKEEQELEKYLAKIRRTVAESNRLVEQTELRIAETDRLLASQGLTREQVMNFKFTPQQRAAVNRELVSSGMDPLPEDDEDDDGRGGLIRAGDMQGLEQPLSGGDDAFDRPQKFGMLMKQFVI